MTPAAAYFESLPAERREVVRAELRALSARDLLSASFVLADLFDVASMSKAPDHLLELEPGLAWETCPHCDGEGWVEGDKPSAWATPYALQFFPDACKTIRPCPRCKGRRDVLEDETSARVHFLGLAKHTHTRVFEAAA